MSHEIEKELRIKSPQVRELVKHARREGLPVCSNEKGYFISYNSDDINMTIQHLQSRTHSIDFTCEKLRTSLKSFKETAYNEHKEPQK